MARRRAALLALALLLPAAVAAGLGRSLHRALTPPPAPHGPPATAARVSYPYGPPLAVVEVAGEAYERGYQQGRAVAARIRAGYGAILAHVARGVEERLHLPGWCAGPLLDFVWWRLAPYVPEWFREEMAGLAAGAGIPYRTVCRVHAIPTLTERGCASFAATRSAAGGPLIHLRNLDWAVESNIQRYCQLTVVRPARGLPFVNVGWSGFLGAVSGMNAAGLSIAEITARSAADRLAGRPMVVRLREVLQEARTLEEAVAILTRGRRTHGFNYVVASALEDAAAAVEVNAEAYARFAPGDPREAAGATGRWARTLPGVVVRASFCLDPRLRAAERAVGGDPERPGLEPPRGAGYRVRYRRQAELLAGRLGHLDVAAAEAIARAIAPASNLQSVVYRFPELYVANAAPLTRFDEQAKWAARAAAQPYRRFDLRAWFPETAAP